MFRKYIKFQTGGIKPWKLSKIGFILDNMVNGSYLAGGSIRSLINTKEPVSDYDLFFKNKESRDEQCDRLVSLGFEEVFRCPADELITLKFMGQVKVQLISKRYYPTYRELLDSFDFNVCKACIEYSEYSDYFVYVTRSFVKGVMFKKLRVENIEYPVATINRIGKYTSRGYRVDESNLADMIFMIQAQEFNGDTLALYID